MPGLSDPTLPATVALAIQVRLAALLADPLHDPTGTRSLAIIVDEIYKAIVAHAIVAPTILGAPTLISAGPGAPVTGVGSIT